MKESKAEYQRLILQIEGWKQELAKWMDRAEALERENRELAQKERREFKWAEEYMAKCRSLELENERLREQIREATEEGKQG